jgi:hypothetical protein
MEVNEAKRMKELERENIPGTVIAGSRRCCVGRAGRGSTACAEAAPSAGAASAAHQAQDRAARLLDGVAHQSGSSGPCLDVGLHLGCDHAGRSPAHANDPGRLL